MSELADSGLSKQTIEKIQRVFNHYPAITQVILYGSRAKNTFHHGSDIDLCITETSSKIASLEQIEIALDDLMLPYQLDLCLLAAIKNTNLLEHIQRVGIVFFMNRE